MIDLPQRARRIGVVVPLAEHWQDTRFLLYLDTDPYCRQWLLQVFDPAGRRLHRLNLDQTIQSIGKPA